MDESSRGMLARESGAEVPHVAAPVLRFIGSLDNEAVEEGVEEAWSEEIKRRVEEVQSGIAR